VRVRGAQLKESGASAHATPYGSVISKVETLVYSELGGNEKQFLEAFLDAAETPPVTQSTIAEAISLRQKRRISLGDALIAETALSNGLPPATHNTEDFAWIDELDVVDPLANEPQRAE